MAETSGTAAPPPAAGRRPDTVAFLARTSFVRLVAALPKLALRRRVLTVTAVSPPPLPEPKYPDYATEPQPLSSPIHEGEAPEKPDTEAEQPPPDEQHAADAVAVAAVAGEHGAHQHDDFTVYAGDAPMDECLCSATAEARVEITNKRPEVLDETPNKAKRKKARKDKRTRDAEAAAAAKAVAGKYWAHRHNLFSLYDRGVRMDAEGWYSATPESVAAAQAARAAPGDLVVDAFAGVGGNSIQFAARGCYVVAVDIDPRKVELARHNARIYGVEGMIEFVVGDFFQLAPYLKADLVFLSPPWGGPSYNKTPIYTLDKLKPKDGHTLFQTARKITPNIIMFLPRNVNISQVEELSWLSSPTLNFESEENYVQHRFKGITAYFGNVAR